MTVSIRSGAAGDVLSILRFHIIGVAMAAELVFAWLLTGALRPELAVLGAVDWCLINLLNRITDLREDRANGIRGTDRVADHQRAFTVAWLVLFAGSFGVTALWLPGLLWVRVLVQAIGLGYSVPLVPTPSGLKRFKDIYFLKNFMSSVLFVLTVFAYPLLATGAVLHLGGWAAVTTLVLFFVPFELTYEILYDMRDLEGDRLAGVPTYPVVHGVETSRRIIDGLLLGATLVLGVGLWAGVIGLREGLMLAAPAVQLAFYRPRYRRGLTSRDCIVLTHIGSALLLLYVAGTQVWALAGLPENIYLR